MWPFPRKPPYFARIVLPVNPTTTTLDCLFSDNDAKRAMSKDRQNMQHRYVELFYRNEGGAMGGGGGGGGMGGGGGGMGGGGGGYPSAYAGFRGQY